MKYTAYLSVILALVALAGCPKEWPHEQPDAGFDAAPMDAPVADSSPPADAGGSDCAIRLAFDDVESNVGWTIGDSISTFQPDARATFRVTVPGRILSMSAVFSEASPAGVRVTIGQGAPLVSVTPGDPYVLADPVPDNTAAMIVTATTEPGFLGYTVVSDIVVGFECAPLPFCALACPGEAQTPWPTETDPEYWICNDSGAHCLRCPTGVC